MTRYEPDEKDRDRPAWGDVAAWADAKAAREMEAAQRKPSIAERRAGTAPLDIHDMEAVLGFEAENHTDGVKEGLILDRFRVMPARYYQRLNAIIITPEALEHDPVLVHRLLERRDARMSARSGRNLIGRNS